MAMARRRSRPSQAPNDASLPITRIYLSPSRGSGPIDAPPCCELGSFAQLDPTQAKADREDGDDREHARGLADMGGRARPGIRAQAARDVDAEAADVDARSLPRQERVDQEQRDHGQ